MANPSRKQANVADRQAREKKKLVFVAVLGIAFVAVLYAQFFAGDPPSDAAPATAFQSDSGGANNVATESLQSGLPSTANEPPWTPTIGGEYEFVTLRSRTIDQIIARHPLAKAEIVAEPIVIVEAAPPAEPIVVRAIYATPKRSTALVGQSIVHDGEVLPDGRRLIAASPQGLKTAAGPSVSTDSSK